MLITPWHTEDVVIGQLQGIHVLIKMDSTDAAPCTPVSVPKGGTTRPCAAEGRSKWAVPHVEGVWIREAGIGQLKMFTAQGDRLRGC